MKYRNKNVLTKTKILRVFVAGSLRLIMINTNILVMISEELNFQGFC